MVSGIGIATPFFAPFNGQAETSGLRTREGGASYVLADTRSSLIPIRSTQILESQRSLTAQIQTLINDEELRDYVVVAFQELFYSARERTDSLSDAASSFQKVCVKKQSFSLLQWLKTFLFVYILSSASTKSSAKDGLSTILKGRIDELGKTVDEEIDSFYGHSDGDVRAAPFSQRLQKDLLVFEKLIEAAARPDDTGLANSLQRAREEKQLVNPHDNRWLLNEMAESFAQSAQHSSKKLMKGHLKEAESLLHQAQAMLDNPNKTSSELSGLVDLSADVETAAYRAAICHLLYKRWPRSLVCSEAFGERLARLCAPTTPEQSLLLSGEM